MNNFLAKLKPDTKKVNVGISVSPNVGVEMMVVDAQQHKIMKYAHRPLAYNSSTREIEDYGEFKQALQDLFNELRITPKDSNVILNMPSVCFGHTFLPTVLDDEGILRMSYGYKENGMTVITSGPLVHFENCIIRTDKRDMIAVLDIKFFDRYIKAGLFYKQSKQVK